MAPPQLVCPCFVSVMPTQSAPQKSFRHLLGIALAQRWARARFGNFVFVTHDVPRRTDADGEFLFLLRAEKPCVPVPDVQSGGHQHVGLLQTKLSLEVDLRVVVDIENNYGLIAADVLTETGHKFLRSCESFFAGDLKINGGLRERPEKIFVGE